MMQCSHSGCTEEGPIVVTYAPSEVRSCDTHWPEMYQWLKSKKKVNVNIGSTIDRWTHVDKKTGREIKHKLTQGKQWEIENRRISKDDPKVVINAVTKRESQY